MKVLVDTHALLWWMGGDARLSELALGILEDGANQRLVSIVSLWEIAIKISLGRLPTSGLNVTRIAEQLREQDFVMIPVRLGDLVRIEKLPWIHRDPFDRLLIAQALEEDAPLLTSDGLIRQYAVQTIW
ncbi:MAG TPA: type II toxin-antitoxin system VapC family toxin [Terracidiphilus sp.]|nr:type II toxin-antitoxin system VapC family toxin [Terracidiphilus sp.]